MHIPSVMYTKTFWTGVAGIATAIGGWATGEISVGVLLQVVVTALTGMFLRSGMTTETKQVTDNSDKNRDCK